MNTGDKATGLVAWLKIKDKSLNDKKVNPF